MRYRNAPIAEAVIDVGVATSTPIDLSILDKVADDLAATFPTRTAIRSFEVGFDLGAGAPGDSVKSRHESVGLRVADNAAKAFRQAWDAYRPEIGDDRWLQWIKHIELVDERAKVKRY